MNKGMFNLLYSLLILRPCFGAFNPELVETFQKKGEDQFKVKLTNNILCIFDLIRFEIFGLKKITSFFNETNILSIPQDLILDNRFIGSSQTGRTYAGSIRSKDCLVLAQSRVSDTCNNCAKLAKIVINRSVLTTPGQWDNGNI